MKKHKTLLSMLAFIVLLGVLYLCMGKEEAQEETQDEVTVAALFDLVSVEYTDNTYTIYFENDGEKWYWTPDETMELEQDSVQELIDSISYVTAIRELTEPDALEDYGLDEPSYKIVMKDAEGVETEICVGDKSGSYYFVKTNLSESVYVVSPSIVDSLIWEITDLQVQEETEEE